MSKLSLDDISSAIRKLDICMMTTRNGQNMLESRPMSNNRDVDYTGHSYFFTLDKTGVIQDLKAHPEVCLVYEGRNHFFTSHLYICVSGTATLIQDRAVMKKHWVKSLDKWFEQGVETPGLTLIHVKAQHIKYWDGWDEGEVAVPQHGPMRLAG